MSGRGSRHTTECESPIDLVQIEGLAVLKIIKHCHEEGAGNMEVAQGVLLGLVQDTKLEVTNCFPFPNRNDEYLSEEAYQLKMMRNLRKLNVDHLHVGWYQSTQQGNFLSPQLLESQYSYQTSIDESVVIIYNPTKTCRGFLAVKAFRLTAAALKLYKDGDFSADAIRERAVGFSNLYSEIPVVIRNSHLANALLLELNDKIPSQQYNQFYDLGTTSVLEKHLRQVMQSVDELCQESNKFNTYQKLVAKCQQARVQAVQRLPADNDARRLAGESVLTEEDISRQYKMPVCPPRLDPMITCGHVENSSHQISEFASQALGKLFITESLHDAANKY